jgi:hypothetical protein
MERWETENRTGKNGKKHRVAVVIQNIFLKRSFPTLDGILGQIAILRDTIPLSHSQSMIAGCIRIFLNIADFCPEFLI